MVRLLRVGEMLREVVLRGASEMTTIFVTVYTTNSSKDEVYIRVNKTHNEAWCLALDDLKCSLSEYSTVNGDQQVDCIESEDPGTPCLLRIINSNNGYEYEAYLIKEVNV